MKSKNADLPVKILLIVVAIILVGFIIAWSMGLFKEKKNDLNDGTERINKSLSSMAEFDLLVYDGASISGSTLIELIDEVKEQQLGIVIKVITLDKSELEYSSSSKTTYEKINPNGLFKGDVHRDSNDRIDNITFTQKNK